MSVPYCNQADITNEIDAINLAAMTQDFPSGDGTGINTTVLNNIILMASNAVDAQLASIYSTPFSGNIPAKVKESCIVFSCEALYARRLTPDRENPFKSRADIWRTQLRDIGAGRIPLDANFPRQFTPIVHSQVYNRANTNFY